MNIEFKEINSFLDEYDFESYRPVLLIIGNRIYEATYEGSNNQFYLHSTGEYIKENSSELTHWTYAEV